MSIMKVLQILREKNISVSVEKGRLKTAAPAGAITDDVAELIRSNKEALVDFLERVAEQGTAQEGMRIAPAPAMDAYPLSFSQQRLWFIDRLQGGSAQYNIPMAFKLIGDLDREALQYGLDEIVARHAVLRTVFAEHEDRPVQLVRPASAVPVAWTDLCGMDAREQDRVIGEWADAEIDRAFDLGQDLMLRCAVIRTAADAHVVLFTMHHIASDGWSMGLLVREFIALYGAYRADRASPLAPLSLQYADYAVWQRKAAEDGLLDDELAYWRDRLSGAPSLHALPLDKERPTHQSFAARRHACQVDRATRDALAALGQRHEATLFMVLQAAFAALLARWSGESDIVMGVPVAGRSQAEVAPLIGFFINTLVFRTDLSEDPTVCALLGQAARTSFDAFGHQNLPFDMLIDALRPERNLAYNPLCQVKFVLQNHDGGVLALPDLRLEPVSRGLDRVRFDLDLTVSESANGLHLSWTYKDELFEAATIERMASAYARLLGQMVARPQARLSELEWLDPEQAQTLAAWSSGPTSTRYRDATLPVQIAAQARRTPQAVAVRDADGAMDYASLDAAANRLAQALAEQGLGRGARVGVHLERSRHLLVALLGVMKSGAAYVVLDPRQPAGRLQAIVADAALTVVVQDSRQPLALAGVDALYVDDAAAFADYAATAPADVPVADDSVYVLYTSGSSGTPKGVDVRHGGLTDYCAFAREGYWAEHLAGSLVATSAAFDLTVPSLYVPLLEGRCVELLPAQDELAALASRLDGAAAAPVLLRLTPSHVQGLLALSDAVARPQAHVFVIGGEAFGVELARALQGKYPQAQVYNHYGPTETVVGCSWYAVTPQLDALSRTIPIGRPMSNTVLRVLDGQGRPVPVGVAGELYIGGAGVARGYVNRPELTASKFVADPQGGEGRLYRSGDRVRWRNDGTLEFLGRLDDQVKLRGFRIELGDIESRLRAQAAVREAVVLVRGGGSEARLVAYVVPSGEYATPSDEPASSSDDLVDALKAQLAGQLPAYMHPSAYVVLERLPLTVNGKLDKAALPAPAQVEAVFAAPEGATETALAAIWSTVLKREGIGRESNFFELGGHSLLATRIVSEVARQFGKPVPVRALFEHPTLRQLAAYVEAQAGEGYAPIPAVAREGRLPLSFAQQRLWFIDRLEGGSAQYNMPTALRLRGALDAAALQQALDTLVARHEVLRTTYVEVEGEAVQVVHPAAPVALAVEDLRALAQEAREAALQRHVRAEAAQPFDLAHDPMLRVRLLVLEEAEHAVLLTMHHIASDGWSVGVLVREFVALYGAFAQGAAPSVPALAVQYADYAAWQRERLQGATLQAQLDYWRGQLAGLPAVHGLPLDRLRPAQQRFEGARVERRVDAATLAALQGLARAHDASLFMVLQAAFAVLLGRWSGESDIVVGTPIAGRLHKDVEPLIGFFVNTLVLRTDLSGNPTFTELLGQVRATALAAYGHQEVPFEMLVDELRPVRSLSHAPLFQVLLSLRNNEQVELALPGLEVTSLGEGYEQAKFDLQLAATEGADGLRLVWSYATALFEADTVGRMGDAFVRLLQEVAGDPQAAIHGIPLLAEGDLEDIAAWSSGPVSTCYRDATLPVQIAAQAQGMPQAIAVRDADGAMDYASLDAAANRLAQALRGRGLGRGARVGVHLERSRHLLVALLGVMKSGAAYVVLDPRQPAGRLQAIVADAALTVVVQDSRQPLALAGVDALYVDDAAAFADYAATAPADVPVADDSVYVLYTSGSSGTPKGVDVRHGGLTDYCAFAREGYWAEHLAGSLVATSAAFDLTVPSLYVPLLEGRCVELLPAQDELAALATRLDGAAAAPVLLRLTPSHVQGLLALSDAVARPQAHVFVIGGEAFGVELARALQGKYPQAQVYNHYGPTETVVGCSWYAVTPQLDALSRTIPIGRPMSNTVLRVLDGQGRPVPVGVAGELYIGGAGVARGYVNRPELTASKFVADPQGGEGRLYRSGDRVRWRNDGTLEFLGRLDDQVKLRGFRIELGDIESRLRAQAAVREAVVLVRGEGSEARLVAYVVPSGEYATPSDEPASSDGLVDALKAQLAGQLPAYMHPSAYVVLERLPLTVNGKLDKAALPAPVFDRAEYTAPATEAERQLASIWQDVLRIERVGIHDNFFEIGGDSILSIQVVARASQAGLAITARQLFETQTIAGLAARAHAGARREAPQEAVGGATALLPIQVQFLNEPSPDHDHYNQAVLLEIPASFRQEWLGALVGAVYRRHDALRLRFAQVDGAWQGEHQPLDDVMIAASCAVESLPDGASEREAFITSRCNHWQGSFDLGKGPLLRAVLFQGNDAARLLLVAHHIVIDGVSWRILLADLERAYRQLENGEPVVLPPKTSSFQQWAAAMAASVDGDTLAGERGYWLERARLPVPPLPVDFEAADCGEVASTAYAGISLPASETELLLQQCNRAYRTQINELLLAAVYLGLRRWTGELGLRIALEGHGREDIFEELDVTQTLGWFTTVYPLTLWSEASLVGDIIKSVKEQYRAVPRRGCGYGVLRHLARDAALIEVEGGQPPSLAFNYLGQSEQAVSEGSVFRGAPESAGAAIGPRRLRRHPLVLKGLVAGGELRLSLEYSTARHAPETVQRALRCIEGSLREVIDHCAQCDTAAFTPSDFPLARVSQAQLDAWQAQYPSLSKLYPATPTQAGLFFHGALDRSAYVTQTIPVFRGTLDVAAFKAAWQAVVQRHDVFRTAFVGEDEQLHQLVSGTATLDWHEEDWRGLDPQAQEHRLDSYRRADRERGFDFARAPLMRMALLRLADDRHQLLWTHHHILSDGWSMPIVYREVMEFYQARLAGRAPELQGAPAFEGYVGWLAAQDQAAARAYWRSQLGSIEAPTPLAIDKLPVADRSAGYREQSLTLSAAEGDALQVLATSRHVTMNTIVQLAWAYVLHCYSGERDVVFGATISGRPPEVPGIEAMVGLFINTIPVKLSIDPEATVADLLADLQREFQCANEFGYLALTDIQRQSQVPAGTQLFESLLVMGNYPIEAAMEAESRSSGLGVESKARHERTGYKLAFNIGLRGRVHLQCGYPGGEFEEETVARLLAHFAHVLRQLPQALDRPIHTIDLLDATEHACIARWNDVPAGYPTDRCVHQLFEDHAARAPEAIAARFDGQALTYAELNREANRVAHYLIDQGVAPDTLVGLCIERSLDMLVGMLGILKAGAAYVPLDPEYPEERLAYMLEDSGVEIVLTHSELLHSLGALGERTVMPLDGGLRDSFFGGHSDANPGCAERGVNPTSLAYAMYTSGSTGQPKGALIEHRNIVRLVHAPNYARFPAGGVMAQVSNSAFDAATFELWGALANGMTLHHIGKETLLDPPSLARAVADAGVTTMLVTTAVFNQVASICPAGFASVDYLLFGGEGVDVEAVNRVLAAGKPRHLVHAYGPTENTSLSTTFEIDGRRTDTYPIGTPISGTTQYVLDARRRPVPCGVVGELYLGGDGVGRGYLGRPELTAERFVPDPFSTRPGARLYRSGDLVRRLPDGNVQFVGRVDDQVKIRGFRIELGEIETQLLGHEAVSEAVILARRDGPLTRLVAYVACRGDGACDNEFSLAAEWRSYLKLRLPDYMIPSAFVVMEALPLNPNGKVDKRRLPEPDYHALQTYAAPQTETERKLADIWKQLLRLEQVGIHDNFFESGGDSILSIQMVARAGQAGIAITTKQLFEAQTIAELARLANAQPEVAAPQDEVTGPLALLPIHRYFLEGEAHDRHHYNQAVLLEAPPEFDEAVLRAIASAVYRRHDALRLRFVETPDGWQAHHQAFIDELLQDSCIVERLPRDPQAHAAFIADRCAYWQRGFDLAAGPLLRAVHFRPPAGQPHASGRLLLAVHHIVVDGVSWRVLLSDLERAYDQALRGEEVRLDAKTSSFQQWGDALATYARSEELREERPFWLAQLGEEVRPLPVDHAIDGLGAIATGKTLPITFSVEDTRALQQHCHTAYRTQISELLLAGVYLGMRAWTGESALRIRLEGHGRESLFDQLDVSQTVGWFTSIFPLTLHSAAGDVGAVIKAVKEQFRAIPRRGIGYGVLRYLAGDAEFAERAIDREGALLFNYLGQFDQVINETTRFQAASEPTGPQVSLERQRATQLGVSGKIFGGQLQLGLNYSRAQYESGTMERLAGLIEDALRAVIAHCQQPGVGSFTPSDFPLARVDQAQLDAWQQRYPALVNVYPATPMQAGLVFHSLLDSAAYVIQSFPVLRGELDLPAFRKAWQQTVDRHDIFRTAFVGEGEAVHQVVSATAVLPWHEEDLRGLPREEQVARYESYRVQDKQAGFDFERAPLMRVAVFRLDDDRYQLLWTQHHVVLDGWCLPLVYRDVIELYRAQTEDRPPALGSPPSFEAYIAWLQTRKEGEAHAHWRALLEDFDAPTPLMSDRTGKGPEQGQREQHLELTAERTDALQALAQAQQTTVNTLLQWCWGYLLHRYSGEGEVVFGATISGRPADIPGIEEMVGMFINTIPVRASFDGTADVRASLARLHRSFHCSNEHGYLSLPEIQRQSRVRAGTPLFDSLVVFENYPLDAVSDGSGTSSSAKLVIDSSGSDEHTTYKLTIGASLRRTLKIKCGYQAEFFSEEVIGRLLGHLQRLLEQLPGIVAQGRPVDLIGEAEAQQLRAWGASGPRAIGADVVACLREWAAVTPDAPAVVFGELRLAYRDLDDRTERLARSLRDAGVSAESRVGLCLGRSAEQLIAVLGVLKAGGAYVPLDPGLPAERVAYMLDDAGVELVLLQSGDAGRVPLGGRDMLLMDQAATDPRWLDDYADGAALPGIAAGQLAYVLYTSGSTGRPKGVMVTHGGLANYLGHARDAYLPAASGGVVSSPLAFDATLTTLLAPLTAGKPVTLLPDDDVLSALAACMFGATQGALFKITPAHLDALALMHPADNAGQAPHCIVVGGEQLRTATLERWRALLPRATFVNEYGPTETVVGCSIFVVDGSLAEVGGAVVPIGRPIANTALQVLSRDGSLQPIGSVGELYIGGAGVARGYANRPDLAAERFVERPFEGGVERMYRTGDLVRWLPSGQLEFVGRCDDQVKVRGFRIELGEVEHVLASLPGVSATAAAVQPDADGENRLAGFVVPVEPIGDADERAAFATRVRDALAERLPAYMIPSAVMVMESLPLTANGKLDRRALPAAQAPAARAEVLAETPTERTVASIWQGLLNIEQVDIMTSFFELGGHSLLVVRLLSELRLHFGIEIAIRDVFDRTTVRALSAFIDECTLQAALKRELALDGAESDDQELIEL